LKKPLRQRLFHFTAPDPTMASPLRIDPRSVPVHSIDAHLPAVPAERLQPEALRRRFAQPPAWAPEMSVERRFVDRAPAQAAVLVPLVMREQLHLLLTVRGQHLSSHSGQIAFPGGRCDDSDTDVVHTALREAEEEVGLVAAHVEVLGTLPVYTTGSAYIVTPVVALVRPGFALQPNPDEVADVFEVPLAFLMDPANHRRHTWTSEGGERQWLSMPWTDPADQERYVWGATAGMLRNLYRFLVA
jgi:8-oxo-dGTP pyrophosphatase MutT (NUDIX family)